MTIEDIEQEVLEWHRATFPNATESAIYKKLDEEANELVDSFMNASLSLPEEEVVDICIVAIALFNRVGGTTLASAIKDKLEINKSRVWGKETENGDRPRVK